MLVAHQLRDRLGVHPLQALDAAGVAALQDAVDQQSGAFITKRLAQHRLHILIVVGDQRTVLAGFGAEAVEHRGHLLRRHGANPGHRLADLVHLLGRQVLEDLRGDFLAKRQQEDRAAFESLIIHESLVCRLTKKD